MIFAIASALSLALLTPDDSFKAGDFTTSLAGFRAALSSNAADVAARVGVARVELYANHLAAAEREAKAVLALDAQNAAAQRVLSVVAQRRAIVASAATLNVPPAGVRIPFIATDPLPLIHLTIGGKAANAILDTGAPDITIDPDFAKEAGIAVHATGAQGTFAGNRHADILAANVNLVDVGGIKIRNVSANVIPSRGFGIYGATKVDAVIGTAFLSRFLATIDYPHGRLVLQPRQSQLVAGANSVVLPFWFVGDHFVLTRGTLNADTNVMMLLDSGLAGGGFSPNNDVVESARVQTFPAQAATGMGGGGAVQTVPAIADTLCLGSLCQQHVSGSYTPEGSPLQIFPFHVEAVVSHTFLKHYAVSFDFERMQLVFN